MLEIGKPMPAATLLQKSPDGPVKIDLADRVAGRRVVIFGLPGALTPTCSSAHLPSFIRTKDAFADAGIGEIICISVNDVHVMAFWAEHSGAAAAGITLLADADSSFTKAAGMAFSNPNAGMFDRSKRYAMVVDDGIVSVLQVEESPGVCELSAGEALLEKL